MSLNLNSLANKVQIAGLNATQLLAILNKLVSFIVLVEQMAADLKGSEKFQTVMAMMESFLSSQGLEDKAKAILDEISWITSFIVKVYNFLKLWPAAVAGQ